MLGHMLRAGRANPVLTVFAPSAYTGNGTAQSIANGLDLSGSGGLVWTKHRTNASFAHSLIDTTRGATKTLDTSATATEGTNADRITAFNSNGFTVGSSAHHNTNTDTYIAWAFRKYAGFFDIVSYTGNGSARTVAHSLGVAPELMIVKNRATAVNWVVYHKDMANTGALALNTTGAFTTPADWWNSTSPTASVIALGTRADTNQNTSAFIAYLFATLAGTSKVGSYTGNGASQAINCGFATGARFVLIKRTDSTGDWYIWDATRGIVAGNDPHISANTATAEVTTDDSVDADSSGFIVNQLAATNINVNAASYVYLAIA
jgi:hypothetical protein